MCKDFKNFCFEKGKHLQLGNTQIEDVCKKTCNNCDSSSNNEERSLSVSYYFQEY